MKSIAAVISRPTQRRSSLLQSPRQAAVMPPLLGSALQSFGLLSAFRARPQSEQIASVSWVAEATNSAEAHERIAHLLDELASEMELYP